MKRKLKKISIFAGLFGLVGAFGLSLFLLDHKKAESVNAVSYLQLYHYEDSSYSSMTYRSQGQPRLVNGNLVYGDGFSVYYSKVSYDLYRVYSETITESYRLSVNIDYYFWLYPRYYNVNDHSTSYKGYYGEYPYNSSNPPTNTYGTPLRQNIICDFNSENLSSFSLSVNIANIDTQTGLPNYDCVGGNYNITFTNSTTGLSNNFNWNCIELGRSYYQSILVWYNTDGTLYDPLDGNGFGSQVNFTNWVRPVTNSSPYEVTTDFNKVLYNGGGNFVIPDDYTSGYEAGYTAGYTDGQNDGFNSGSTTGYNNGYSDGYSQGKAEAESQYSNYYNNGYSDGYNAGYSTDSTVTSIFSGILQVALVPINFFLAIFNFEILGINLSGFIRALFTIAITIIVIRTIFGGKGASDS